MFDAKSTVGSLKRTWRVAAFLGSWSTLLLAQVPVGWDAPKPLGRDQQPGWWMGVGFWAADRSGGMAPLVASLGLGNAVTGSGCYMDGGWSSTHGSMALRLNAYDDLDGRRHVVLDRGHITWSGADGACISLEREPLVWGFGLNGGYVLGAAAAPVPKLRVSSGLTPREVFGIPLGTWQAEGFVGRMGTSQEVPETIQSPSLKTREIRRNGSPERPFLFGYRAYGVIAEDFEIYANWIVLMGGTLRGRRVDEGYSFGQYLTAALGIKDLKVEGGIDMNNLSPQDVIQDPGVHSTASSDVGVRFRTHALERAFKARDVRVYISRGSKGVHVNHGAIRHKPLWAIWQDIRADLRSATDLSIAGIWGREYRYTAPSPIVPNDAVGLLVDWGDWKAGVEYLNTANPRNYAKGGKGNSYPLYGHRSFTHWFYQVGFYEDGDPLGSGLGGEARYGTLFLEGQLNPQLHLKMWLQGGDRPFRDDFDAWQLDHSGKVPVRNRFLQAQLAFDWKRGGGYFIRGGLSAQRQSAEFNESGRTKWGSRWYLETGRTWGLP